MMLASSGWNYRCHYTIVHNRSTMDFEITFTFPGGKVIQHKSSSLEAASEWISKMSSQVRMRDEAR